MASIGFSSLIPRVFEFFKGLLLQALKAQGWISSPTVPTIVLTPPRLRIPDLLEHWPWPAQCNTAYTDQLRDEEQAFFLSLPEVKASQQLQKVVHQSYVPILTANMFPNVTEAQLRAVIKFAQWTILIEDPLEQEDDLNIVNDIVEGSCTTFRKPDVVSPHPDELGRTVSLATREVFSTKRIYERFIDGVTNGYIRSIMRKATQHKLQAPIPPMDEWFQIRIHNYAMDCFPTFFEFEDPLPEELVLSPLLQSFVTKGATMCFLANDLYSHNKEQAVGDTYNTLSVAMHHFGLDLDGAVDWVEAEHTRILKEFLAELRDLPSFGSEKLDVRVRKWIGDIGRLVRGNVEWHFIAPRYFAGNGAIVRKQGYVDLLPKKLPLESVGTKA